MGDYRKLEVWKLAHQLALHTYRATGRMPKSGIYGLVSQMRRAAVSVTSNIVEGAGRRGDKEMAYFIRVALGSVNELQCQYHLGADLGWITPDVHCASIATTDRLRAMLEGLRVKLASRRARRSAMPPV
ncbi:MAG: four helix bundle protein [Gemmatimonadales bacterium]